MYYLNGSASILVLKKPCFYLNKQQYNDSYSK